MSNSEGKELNPTANDQEPKFPVISEIPPILSQFLLEDFSEGKYEEIITPNDGVWRIVHHENSDEDQIISISPKAYYNRDTYKVILLSEKVRKIGKIVKDSKKNSYKPLIYAIKLENSEWTILSLDQNPSDLQP